MFNANGFNLTPTEQDLFDALRDGKRHTVEELLEALGYIPPDGLKNFRFHLSKLRTKIRRFGIGILDEREGSVVVAYSFVRVLAPSRE